MAKIVNLESMQVEDVEDSSVDSLISSGTHGFLNDFEVPVLERSSGAIGTLPANEAINEIKSGQYSFMGDQERVRRGLEDKFGGPIQQAIGIAEQAASGLTLGGSELIETALGVPKEDIAGRDLVTGAAGDIASFAGTMFPLTKAGQTLKVAKVLGSPVRAVDKLGMGAETIAKLLLDKTFKKGVLKRAAELGTRGSVEGGLISGADYLKESALGNTDYNAESLVMEVMRGAKLGGAGGAVLGGGMAAAAKAAKKAKLKIGKSKKDFAGINDSDGGLRLYTKGKDLKQKDLSSDIGGKGSEFYIDEKSGLYKYSDGVRDVYIDPAKIQGKTLTLSDVDELNKIGAQLEIDNLASKVNDWDSSKEGFSEFLESERIKVLDVKADQAIKNSIGRINRNSNVANQLAAIRKGYNRHRKIISKLQSSDDNALNKAKIKKSRVKIAELQKSYKKLSAERRGISKPQHANVDFTKAGDDVNKVLNNYSAIKIGKRVIVKNLDSVDDAIHYAESAMKKREAIENLSFGDLKTLKLSGAMKAFFKKKPVGYQKELAEFMRKNFRSEVNDRLINHPALTDLDDLMNNVATKKIEAVDQMNSSINRMENYLEANNLSSTITGDKVANFIDSEIYTKYYDPKRGQAIPGFEGVAEDIRKFSDEFRRFGKDKITGAQKPFTPSEFREMRINLDKFPGLDFDKKQSISQELIKATRNKMEDLLIKDMSKFDDVGNLVKRYKEAKKTYGLASDADRILEDRFARENANNSISLTGYLSAGAGAGIGGLPGAVAALGARELGRAYGNNLMALYADRIFKASNGISNKITKSVNGFLSTTGSLKITPAVKALTTKSIDEQYNDDIKEIDSGKYNYEVFSEEFIENNQGLINSAPKISDAVQRKMMASYSMLMEKLPRNPYEGSFLRKYRPADSEVRKFQKFKNSLLNPEAIFKQIETGMVTNESIEVLERIYPAIYKVMQFEMMEKISTDPSIGYKKRNQINKLFKIQTDSYQRVDNVILLQEMIKGVRSEDMEKGGSSPEIKGNKESQRSKHSLTSGQRMMER